ncbi:MAG: InlB B-repeat-containing protein [Clostridiales bacterium]|nr:InlB B-repeat-containing protein [Clostridiales bacterium]
MRITKKVLSLILAFCMAFSVFSVAVVADSSASTAEAVASTGLRVTKADGSPLDGTTLAPGDVVRCYVGWQTNYNWRTISNIVYYDTNYFVTCYPSGNTFVEQTGNYKSSTIVTASQGVFHPITSADYAAEGKDVPAAGVIYENVGNIMSGQINNTITAALIAQNFPPEMRTYNEATGKYNNVLKSEYASYNFVQSSVSTSATQGTGESFIIDEYQEYFYFYLKVKDTATLNGSAGLFMNQGSVKGDTKITAEKNYGQGKTYCTYTSSEDLSTGEQVTLSRATCTVLTPDETKYTISTGAVAEKYTVDFDLNGGTGTAPASVTDVEGTPVTLPATVNATKSGFNFKGWNTSSNATTALTSYSIPKDGATLYAVWEAIPTYTVNFDLNGGTGTAPASVTNVAGTAVSLPATVNATKEGYKFVGWAESNEATTALSSYSISGNATLYAVWRAIEVYNVTNDENSITLTYTEDEYDGEIELNVEKLSSGSAFALVAANSDQCLVYDITAKLNGVATQPNGSVTVSIPLPEGFDSTKTSVYYINGNDMTLIPSNYENGFIVFEATHFSIYALATEKTAQYTVDFDLNGGTGTAPASVTGAAQTAVDLPDSVNASKEGCEFIGWATTKTATTALTSYAIPEGGSTLYAIWAAKDYTITYQYADGTTYLVKTYKFGQNTSAAPAVPNVPEGNTGSWNAETPATMPAQNLEIKAVYTPNIYTITYENENGSVIETVEVTYGTVVTIKGIDQIPGKDGSWVWTDSNNNTVSAPTTMPAYNLIATLHYEDIAVSYKVETYEMDTTGKYQLTDTTSKTASANSDVSFTPAAAATGFTFDADSSNLSGNVGTVDNTLTLKVYYSRNQYTFNYVVEEAPYASQTYYYGAVFALPEAPQPESPKSFKGWLLNGAAFSAPQYVGAYDSATITLVADIDDGTVKYADYTALYNYLESDSVVRDRTTKDLLGFQSYFPLLPKTRTERTYLERAAEELEHYKEPAKSAIANALSFRTDCTEAEQSVVDGYLTTLKSIYKQYIDPLGPAYEEYEYSVTAPDGTVGTEFGYRNQYTWEYYAENYNAKFTIENTEVKDDGTYIFDVKFSSNFPVATFGIPILINSDMFEKGTLEGTTLGYTTPKTEYFTGDNGFNKFYGYAEDGVTTLFREHDLTTNSNKARICPGVYPEGPGWSAFDDLEFRNQYGLDLLLWGATKYSSSAPFAQSFDDVTIATFAIKLKAGATLDKSTAFMVGDYFIGNQKPGEEGLSRTLYTVTKSKNSELSGGERSEAPMANLTTEVTWQAEPETFTVDFDLNGAEGTAPQSMSGTENTTITLPDPGVSRQGYTFAGWAESANATTVLDDEYTITKDVTLYAIWTENEYNYTISYIRMGIDGQYPTEAFKVVNDNKATYGTVITLTENDMETFDNFYFDENAQGNVLTGTVERDNNVNLVVYLARAQYEVKFVINEADQITTPNGSLSGVIYTENVYFGAPVPTVDVPTDTEHPRGVWEWTKTEDGSKLLEAPETVSYALTATANYSSSFAAYTIETQYQNADGSWGDKITTTKTGTIGTTVYADPSIATGYKLGEGSVTEGMVAEDGSLVLKVFIARDKYIVSYYKAAGEDAYASQEYYYEQPIVPVDVPKDENENDGIWVWNTEDGSQPAKMPALEANETLFAVAKYPVKVVPTIYKAQLDGSYVAPEGTDIALYGNVGDTVKVETAPTFTGFTLVTDPDAEYTSNLEATITDEQGGTDKPIVLYYARNSYTITYLKEDGTTYQVDTYVYEQNVSIPDVPSLEGRNGVWYDKDENVAAIPGSMIAENLVYHAVYSNGTFKLSFVADGYVVSEASYEYGADLSNITLPEMVYRGTHAEGYTGSWGQVPPTMPGRDTEITATYEANQYTITFVEEGKDNEVAGYRFGETVEIPALVKADGAIGVWVWTKTVGGESVQAPTTMPAYDLTATADYSSAYGTYTVYTYRQGFDGEYGDPEISDPVQVVLGTEVDVTPSASAINGYTLAASSTTTGKVETTEGITLSIYLVRNTYKITYVNGNDSTEVEYLYDAPVDVQAPVDAATGATGVWNWKTTADNMATVEPAKMPAADLTATADFTGSINTYTVKYWTMNASGTYELTSSQTLNGAVDADVTADYEVPANYTLSDDSNVTGKIPAVGEEALVLNVKFARNTFKLNFVIDGVTVESKDVIFGAAIVIDEYDAPAIPKDGNGNDGIWVWPTADNVFTMPTEDVTVVAQYPELITITPVKYVMDVSGNYDNGTALDPVYGIIGGQVSFEPAGPEMGFSIDEDITVTETTINADGNATLAVYYKRNTYTITYVTETGSETESYLYGATVVVRNDPTKAGTDGATVTGQWTWKTADNEPATAPENNEMPAVNLVATATFGYTSYTIVIKDQDTNGQTFTTIDTITVENALIGDTVTYTPAAKEGFATPAPITETVATGLEIEVKYLRNTYTITYVNGNDSTTDSYLYGADVDVRSNPVIDNVTGSWVWTKTVESEEVPAQVPNTMPAYNLTATATFAKADYTVVIKLQNTDGETFTTVKTTTVEDALVGSSVTYTPDQLTDLGYTDTGIATPEAITKTVESGLVIEVKYLRNTYTVTYINGNDSTEVPYIYGAAVADPDAPTIDGEGVENIPGTWTWSTGTKPATMPAENVTATATFARASYTVVVRQQNVDGQTFETIATIPVADALVGDTVTYTADASADAGFVTPAAVSGTVLGDNSLVLYADYTRNSFTITFVDGENTTEQTFIYGAAINVAAPEGGMWLWTKNDDNNTPIATPATMPAYNIVATASYAPVESKAVYAASYEDHIITVEADKDALKIAICLTVDGELMTWTYTKTSDGVVSVEPNATNDREIWTIDLYLANGDYVARAKFAEFDTDEWTDDDHSAAFTVVNPTEIPKVYSATYDNGVLVVVVDSGADKILVEGTITYQDDNHQIQTADFVWTVDKDNASVETDPLTKKDTWTINKLLDPATYTVRGKYAGKFTDDENSVTLVVSEETPELDKAVYSATYDPDTKTLVIVADAGAEKVSLNKTKDNAQYMLTFARNDEDVTVAESATEAGKEVWTITSAVEDGVYTVCAKYVVVVIDEQNSISEWTDADHSATLTVTNMPQAAKVISAEYTPEVITIVAFAGATKVSLNKTKDGEPYVLSYLRNDAKVSIVLNDDGTETWTINDYAEDGVYMVKAKYNGEWTEDPESVELTVSNASDTAKIFSATFNRLDKSVTVVAGAGAQKIQFVNVVVGDEIKTITYARNNALVNISDPVDGKETWTISETYYGDGEYVVNGKFLVNGIGEWTEGNNSATLVVENVPQNAKVYSATYTDGILVIEVTADAERIKFEGEVEYKDGTKVTGKWTYLRSDNVVTIATNDANNEVWTIDMTVGNHELDPATYTVYARFNGEYTAEEDSATFTVEAAEVIDDPVVVVVESNGAVYAASYDNGTVVIKAEAGAVKVRIDQDATEGSEYQEWVFAKNSENVTVTADENDATKEIWTITGVTLKDGTYNARAKYVVKQVSGNDVSEWTDNDKSQVLTLETGVVSAVQNDDGSITIVVKGDVSKIQLENAKGTYTFAKGNSAVSVSDKTWTITSLIVPGTYKINVKSGEDWVKATDSTPTITIKQLELEKDETENG